MLSDISIANFPPHLCAPAFVDLYFTKTVNVKQVRVHY